MAETSSTALKPTESAEDSQHSPMKLRSADAYATLMLDRSCRILSCGDSATKVFGLSQLLLMGRPISEFIPGILSAGRSPSFGARYLAHLCAEGKWRTVAAKDAMGRQFKLELHLSKMVAGGREIFLLTMRRFDAAKGPRRQSPG